MKLSKVSVAIIIAVLVLMAIASCVPHEIQQTTSENLQKVYTFTEFEYKGMPCLLIHVSRNTGLTCDWSQYDGA